MKTTFIEGAKADVRQQRTYGLDDLENKNEMLDLITEIEKDLKPCAHCGRPNPAVWYYYDAEATENPHRFYIWCCALPVDGKYPGGCMMRTIEWGAEDDDENADIKETLRILAERWNQRVSGINKAG